MTEYTLFIPCTPTAKGRPKFRRTGQYVTTYTPKATRAAETAILAAWRNAYGSLAPLDCALELSVVSYMPVPKSFTKKRVRQIGAYGEWHLTKPDADNLLKLVQDALNGVAYTDDNRICVSVPVKVYASCTPGLFIRLRCLTETPNDYLTAHGLPIPSDFMEVPNHENIP